MYLFIVVCLMSTMSAFAQSSMTQAQLSFRNQIERFLKEEGFFPTIDTDDNSVNFKREGSKFWITVEGKTPFYIEIHKGGFTLEGTNQQLILEACNQANSSKRWAKAYAGSSSVSFSVEFYCPSIDVFTQVFYKALSSLDSSKEAAQDYYNEHDN